MTLVDDDSSLLLMTALIVCAASIYGWWHAMARGEIFYTIALGMVSLYWTHAVTEMVLLRLFP